MRILLATATTLQVAAVVYGILLLRRHRTAPIAWLCLLGALLSMLVWRVVVTTGATPSPVFNTTIAIWGSVCAVMAMYFFGHEVTRRERAEAERDLLLSSERVARGEAEHASRVKDDFVATVSHELRSPLAAMLGWCALARREATTPGLMRAIDTIERNARKQTRLVDDLLDATSMQAGSLHLDVAPVALDGPVLAAIEDVRPSAEAKGLRLRFSGPTPAPVVSGDASRLEQIASNLLVNAVKFSREGTAIDVTLAASGTRAELVVRDEGVGIEAAFMPQLFQRFRQASTGNARRHGGVGLGLSIVSSLVDLHGGEVRAMSDGPGRGATFVVRLPLAATTAAPLGPRDAPSAPEHAGDAVRVLLVDDEADVREAVAGLLERAGVVVRALDSGATIQAAIAEFQPDVLVLDIGMPGEDGYALIRRVRGLPAADGGTLPAISLTAHAREQDRQHAIDTGFQAHLAKPVDVATLLATLQRLAGRGAVAEPSAEVVPTGTT